MTAFFWKASLKQGLFIEKRSCTWGHTTFTVRSIIPTFVLRSRWQGTKGAITFHPSVAIKLKSVCGIFTNKHCRVQKTCLTPLLRPWRPYWIIALWDIRVQNARKNHDMYCCGTPNVGPRHLVNCYCARSGPGSRLVRRSVRSDPERRLVRRSAAFDAGRRLVHSSNECFGS